MEKQEDRTGTWQAYGISKSGTTKSRLGNSASDPHEFSFTKPIILAGNARFIDHLSAHFPEVAAVIDEEDFGVLNLEVGALEQATRDAIQRRDWSAVQSHFIFVDSVLEIADIKLHDAIGISYLGSLFYCETAIDFAKARSLMPKRLATALEIIERHYEERT
jgi:hypothetical protein